jgi:nitrogen fixation NifU-like protein
MGDVDLKDLYQEVILDHSKHPRNFREIKPADAQADGFNALCGDKLTLYVSMDGERIKDVAFVGAGCAISKASASMMTASLKGKTRAEAEVLVEQFHKMITGEQPDLASLGKLAVFSGVCEFPARVKCASLAWRTLEAALAGSKDMVTSE